MAAVDGYKRKETRIDRLVSERCGALSILAGGRALLSLTNNDGAGTAAALTTSELGAREAFATNKLEEGLVKIVALVCGKLKLDPV